MTIIDIYLAHLVDVVEGPEYTNNPNDSGGPTKYGITLKALSDYRQKQVSASDVENLTREEAIAIYTENYINKPGFNNLVDIDYTVALECIDTGINMGPSTATKFLQRALNAFSNNGSNWTKINVDGQCGAATVDAIHSMQLLRGQQGMAVLAILLNCIQGSKYLDLVESNSKDGAFMYGWIKNRIQVNIDANKYGE